DPKKIPPPPAPPLPPELQKEAMANETQKTIKAAELMQQDVESQREAALKKYAIDSKVGDTIIRSAAETENDQAMEAVRAHHEASTAALTHLIRTGDTDLNSLKPHVDAAHAEISKYGQQIGEMHGQLTDVFSQVNKAVKIATGKRVIRKNDKGEIDGVDILGDNGEVLASHKAIKDKTGRVTGMQ
ncbi:MAG: hypothetical protein ACREDR_05075, partial [Blastocatellia bacterium]